MQTFTVMWNQINSSILRPKGNLTLVYPEVLPTLKESNRCQWNSLRYRRRFVHYVNSNFGDVTPIINILDS